VHPLLRIGASILVLAILPPPQLRRFEAVESHMGTLVRITVYAPAEPAANEGFRPRSIAFGIWTRLSPTTSPTAN